jgi:hypothetical protein
MSIDDRKTIRRKIREKLKSYTEIRKTVELSKASAILGNLEEHRETTDAVNCSCHNVDKLLEALYQHATVKMPDTDKGEPLEQQKRQELEIAQSEIKRIRAFAADDTAMETSSVADYSADAAVPNLFAETPFTLETAEIADAARKVGESMEIVFQVVEENPQWWNSAVLLRRLKTFTVRANYHARRIKRWGDHMRSHILVASTQLNKTGIEATYQLVEMRTQLESLRTRKEHCRKRMEELEKVEKELQEEFTKLETERELLDRKLINAGRNHNIVRPDVMRCEAYFFLKKLALAAPQLRDSAETLAQWVAANEFLLV